MKNKFSFLTALCWLTALAVTGALLLTFAPKQEHASQSENRMLEGFPEFSAQTMFNGEFSTGLENYLSDQFFGRNEIIRFSDRLMGKISLATEEDAELLDNTDELVAQLAGGDDADVAESVNMEAAKAEGIKTDTDVPLFDEEAADNGVTAVPEGDYRAFRLKLTSGGTEEWFTYPMDNIQRVADTLDEYSGLIPDNGRIFYAQPPSSGYARHWCKSPEKYSGWESDMEEALDDMTNEKVTVINAPAVLESHLLAGEELYFYGDHHWNSRGAYVMYDALMKAQGVPAVPFDEYQYRVNSAVCSGGQVDSYEYLYPLSPVHSMIVSNVGREKEVPLIGYNLTFYYGYLNGTQTPWRRIETGSNTGRKALFICDSYGNALVPFMLPHYDEVHMVDLRPAYFAQQRMSNSVAELISIYGIDDIYFLFYEANDLNSGTQQKYLLQNLYA